MGTISEWSTVKNGGVTDHTIKSCPHTQITNMSMGKLSY